VEGVLWNFQRIQMSRWPSCFYYAGGERITNPCVINSSSSAVKSGLQISLLPLIGFQRSKALKHAECHLNISETLLSQRKRNTTCL